MTSYGRAPDDAASYGTAPPPAGKGSISLALASGLGAAVAGAFGWGLIAYVSQHQFSIVAVLMGLAVGSAVARFRPGDLPAAIASGILAVAGCALGTFLALVFGLAGAGVSMGSILGHLNLVIDAYPHALSGLTIIFWVIAAFAAFRIPFSRPARRGVPRPPAQGAPAQAWPASQAGQPAFGQPPGDQFPAGQAPAGGSGDQPQPGTGQGDGAGDHDGPGFALPPAAP
jgi:hypothetical protein